MSHEVFDRKVDGMICPQCEDEIAHRLLHTRGMADVIAADLSRMAPLHQLMRQMRAQAERAAQEAVREREAKARADAQADAAKPAKLVVRSADEFEF